MRYRILIILELKEGTLIVAECIYIKASFRLYPLEKIQLHIHSQRDLYVYVYSHAVVRVPSKIETLDVSTEGDPFFFFWQINMYYGDLKWSG